MFHILLIAARSLVQHKRRTLMLSTAIAAVTGLLVVLQAVSNGIQETMFRNATTLMTGHINVGGFFKPTAGQSSPLVTQKGRILEVINNDVPGVDHVVSRLRGWGKIISDSGSMQVGLSGIDILGEPTLKDSIHMIDGNLDELSERNTVLLYKQQADRLEVGTNDMLTISTSTARGVANTVDVRVVGVAQDIGMMSMFSVFVSGETLRTLYQLADDTTGVYQIYFKKLNDLPGAVASLRSGLEAAGFDLMEPDPRVFFMKFEAVNRESWTGQRLDVTTWEDEISFLTWTLTALDALTGMLIGILMVIIVIGIMNTLWIAIRERTREIGTLRAIGMQRMKVLWMFLSEAMMLGLVGTVGGALAGVVIAAGLNAAHISVPKALQFLLMTDTLWLSLHAGTIAAAVGAISVVTSLAAVYPAYRATRLEPVTAMHHVG